MRAKQPTMLTYQFARLCGAKVRPSPASAELYEFFCNKPRTWQLKAEDRGDLGRSRIENVIHLEPADTEMC